MATTVKLMLARPGENRWFVPVGEIEFAPDAVQFIRRYENGEQVLSVLGLDDGRECLVMGTPAGISRLVQLVSSYADPARNVALSVNVAPTAV